MNSNNTAPPADELVKRLRELEKDSREAFGNDAAVTKLAHEAADHIYRQSDVWERCARICEEFNFDNYSGEFCDDDWADMCAAAIRAEAEKVRGSK